MWWGACDVNAEQVKESLVCQVPLFAALPRSEIADLAGRLRPAEAPAGALLVREGEPGDRMFIVVEGEVEIIKALGTDDERVLSVQGAGGYFGEMSLLGKAGVRMASARALTPVQLWELSRGDFETLLQRSPALAYDMLRELSDRLRSAQEERIADLREKNLELTETCVDLRTAQARIVEQGKLEHELELARQIQERILPRRLPQVEGFELAARIAPAHAVGGDLFDFIPLAPHLTGIAVGDVAGKGVAAAIIMALTRSLVRAEADPGVSPVDTLRRVNRLLRDMNDSPTFVTMLYGVLDSETRLFSYARAGARAAPAAAARRHDLQPADLPGAAAEHVREPGDRRRYHRTAAGQHAVAVFRRRHRRARRSRRAAGRGGPDRGGVGQPGRLGAAVLRQRLASDCRLQGRGRTGR